MKIFSSAIIVCVLLVSCAQRKKSTCVCTTTYSGEGSEYYEDETVRIESYNGCINEDSTISQDGLTIRFICKEA
jgi:hypothetical protein